MSAPSQQPFEATLDQAFLAERLGRWFGVYPALVTDVRDPDGQARVKVRLPWSPDPGGPGYEAWARLATAMAGPGRGLYLIPEVQDEVLVGFEAGDPRRPYVLGSVWNGSDAPPERMDGAGRNNLRLLRSRRGHQIRLDDTDGQETLTVETPAGQRITMRDSPASVEVTDSNGNTVQLDTAGITVTANSKVTVSAASAEITASTLTVNAATSTFSGAVHAMSVHTPSVVAASYTPGAGNIW